MNNTDHFAYALEQANIGYNWSSEPGKNCFLRSKMASHDLVDAIAIEQALVNYGFTQAEIDHLKF